MHIQKFRRMNLRRLLLSIFQKFDIRILETDLPTGFIAEIGHGKPVIALRADIDALPIKEKNTFDYASQTALCTLVGMIFTRLVF